MQTNGVTAGDATGSVAFLTNSVAQSTGPVMNGVAGSAPALVPAAYTVTASYPGDGTYLGSTNIIPDDRRRGEHHADEHRHERFRQPAHALLAR